MRKSHWISLAIALVIAGCFAFLEQRRGHFYFTPGVDSATVDRPTSMMQRAEWATLDARFKIRGDQIPDPNIIIIKIDEKSLEQLHQWPWPRSIHARLIDTLSKAPPRALLFDVLFIDPFTSDPAGDRALVRASRENPWVVHSFFFETAGDRISSVKLPFPALLDAAANTGYVNAFIDDDGILRSAMPQMKVEDQTLSLLSVVGAGVYLNKPIDELLHIPHDPKGRMIVNFVGKAYTFQYVSYVDILNGTFPAAVLKDRIVLVGSTATGTFDHYPTPTSQFMPGVEFHANVINNLLRMNALRWMGLKVTLVAIALLGLFCGLIVARYSAWAGALWALGAGLLYFTTAQWLFAVKNTVIDMAGPLLTLGLGYGAIIIYRFFTEEREKRLVKSFFSQQVSKELLDVLMENPDVLKKGGERRTMTAFFSDVAGFTSISERLRPEELVDLLNSYLTAMTDVIFEYNGYLDKYMGDGIMAFWNGLLKQPNHAELACRAALKSKQRLKELNEEFKRRGLAPLNARIGINTGEMAAGYMGSSQKKQYTIMGDNVNLASRLEGANKAFGTEIMVSEFTCDNVHDLFEVRFLDIIRVPGKAKPVKTYELLGEKGKVDPLWEQALPLYHQAIQEFGGQSFSPARAKFLEVLKILGHDKPCETYIQRAEAFIANPPPKDWDGVFELKTK